VRSECGRQLISLTIIGRIVQELIATIVVDVAALYKAAEAIALLDLLWAFSHVSISKDSALSTACSDLIHTVRNYGLLISSSPIS
jgi:DNA mismatch repair protein MSH4